MNEITLKIIEMIQNISPAIWEVSLLQVKVDAAKGFVLADAFFVFAYMCYRGLKQDKENEDTYTFGFVVFLLLGIIIMVEVIARLYNPAYYAFKLIISVAGVQ